MNTKQPLEEFLHFKGMTNKAFSIVIQRNPGTVRIYPNPYIANSFTRLNVRYPSGKTPNLYIKQRMLTAETVLRKH